MRPELQNTRIPEQLSSWMFCVGGREGGEEVRRCVLTSLPRARCMSRTAEQAPRCTPTQTLHSASPHTSNPLRIPHCTAWTSLRDQHSPILPSHSSSHFRPIACSPVAISDAATERVTGGRNSSARVWFLYALYCAFEVSRRAVLPPTRLDPPPPSITLQRARYPSR